MTCGFCKTVLPDGRTKWCSRKCLRLAARKYDARAAVCEVCNGPIKKKGSFRYCSTACSKKAKVLNFKKLRQEKLALVPRHCRFCDKIINNFKKFYCDQNCFNLAKADKLRNWRARGKAIDLPGNAVVGDCIHCHALETEVTFREANICKTCSSNKDTNGVCPHFDCGKPLKKFNVKLLGDGGDGGGGKRVWKKYCTSCDVIPGHQDVVLLNDFDNREKTVWFPIQKGKRLWVWVYKSHFVPRHGLVVTVPLAWWVKQR